MNLTATSSPVALSRQSFATPKLPLPISRIYVGCEGGWPVFSSSHGPQGHCRWAGGQSTAASQPTVAVASGVLARPLHRPSCLQTRPARTLQPDQAAGRGHAPRKGDGSPGRSRALVCLAPHPWPSKRCYQGLRGPLGATTLVREERQLLGQVGVLQQLHSQFDAIERSTNERWEGGRRFP